LIPLKAEQYTVKGIFHPVFVKTQLAEITPFENTLYLDADMIWLPQRSVQELIDSLQDIDFTMANRGAVDLSRDNIGVGENHWCNLNELKEAYKIDKGQYWNLSSEMIWFKNTQDVAGRFTDAKFHYKTIKVDHVTFAGGVPDELCFSLSMLKNIAIVPHKLHFTPIYWQQAESGKVYNPADVHAHYFAYSLGGNVQSKDIKMTYDNYLMYYVAKVGITNPLRCIDKREFSPLRTNI
jgi:hypothetical protein